MRLGVAEQRAGGRRRPGLPPGPAGSPAGVAQSQPWRPEVNRWPLTRAKVRFFPSWRGRPARGRHSLK